MWFARLQILICEPQSIRRKLLVLSYLFQSAAPILCCTSIEFKFMRKFSELIKNLSGIQKSETFVHFAQITSATTSRVTSLEQLKLAEFSGE
jgi:hypothetical protein